MDTSLGVYAKIIIIIGPKKDTYNEDYATSEPRG